MATTKLTVSTTGVEGLPELHPLRFDRCESAAIKAHLTEHGVSAIPAALGPPLNCCLAALPLRAPSS